MVLEDIIALIQNALFSYGIEIKEGNFLGFITLLIGLTLLIQLAIAILMKVMRLATSKTTTTLDDEILVVVSKYFPLVAFLTSAYISFALIYPNFNIGSLTTSQLYIIVLLVILAFLVTGVVDVFLVWYGISIQPPKRKPIDRSQVFPFVRSVVKLALFVIFCIFILQIAGFDTTALITGLGIGGLAVALALQDTLGNFFAGIHILIDKPFREGDYILLEGGQEGTVDRIGWRTTKLITIGKDEIIIPNSKLANSIVKNYSTPREETGVVSEISVSYDSDIEKVIETIKTAIRNVEGRNENLVKDSGWARLERYGDYSLIFKFGYLVYGYKNAFWVRAEVNKEIFKEFKKNKIEIPFPIMTVKGLKRTEK